MKDFLEKRRGEEKAIGVQCLRRLNSRHLIPFSYSTLMTLNSNLYFLHLIMF